MSETEGHEVVDAQGMDEVAVLGHEDKTDGDDATGRPGLAPEVGQVVEDVYELRLTALLRQLVQSRGYGGAGRTLGLDRRTIAASVQQGLSQRVRDQLEWALVDKDAGARDALEDRVNGLAQQMAGQTKQIAGLESELREAVKALERTHARELQALERRWERRLTRLQEEVDRIRSRPAPEAAAVAPGAGQSAPVRPRRRYPDLVAREEAEGDAEALGDAWPLVQEWRELWRGHPARGRGFRWVSTRTRILELEVAMLEEHGLTLPPEREPLRGLDRGDQLNWRVKALAEFRRRRFWLGILPGLWATLTLKRWRG